MSSLEIVIRSPLKKDAPKIYNLMETLPELTLNARYCYLLFCTDFSKTSAVIEQGDDIVGFLIGYIRPDHPDSLFFLQVGVSEAFRGCRYYSQMVKHVLAQPVCRDIRYFEGSISAANKSSIKAAEKLAEIIDADLNEHSVLFDKNEDFSGECESQTLFRVGPLVKKPELMEA